MGLLVFLIDLISLWCTWWCGGWSVHKMNRHFFFYVMFQAGDVFSLTFGFEWLLW